MPLARHSETAGGAVWRRVQWLDHEIRAGRAPTKRDLCERFGVQESCATQTVAFMREQLGLPLDFDRSRGGYVYREVPPTLPAAHPGLLLSKRELAALRLAASLATRYLDWETAEDLKHLAERLVEAAEPALATEHHRWGWDVVFTGPPPLPGRHLQKLKGAIEQRQVLSLDYRAPGHADEVTREVEPHFLVNAGGDWLLVGWDRDREAPRTFATSRIQWCETLKDRFERRSGLEGESFTQHQFLSEGGPTSYPLVVRFNTQAGRIAGERKWHPSQEVRTAEDGRLELTLNVSGTGDVLRWLLSFGSAVEVVSPNWLRQRLCAEAQAAAELNAPGEA